MNEKEPVEDHKEWISHQYDPGHYTGGHTPHWATHQKNRRPLAIVILVSGLLIVGKAIQDWSATGFEPGALVPLGLGGAFVVLALRTMFRRKK